MGSDDVALLLLSLLLLVLLRVVREEGEADLLRFVKGGLPFFFLQVLDLLWCYYHLDLLLFVGYYLLVDSLKLFQYSQ